MNELMLHLRRETAKFFEERQKEFTVETELSAKLLGYRAPMHCGFDLVVSGLVNNFDDELVLEHQTIRIMGEAIDD